MRSKKKKHKRLDKIKYIGDHIENENFYFCPTIWELIILMLAFAKSEFALEF